MGIVKRRTISSDNQESEIRGVSFNSVMNNSTVTSPLFKASQSPTLNMPPSNLNNNLTQTMTRTHGGGLIKGGSYSSFATKEEVAPPVVEEATTGEGTIPETLGATRPINVAVYIVLALGIVAAGAGAGVLVYRKKVTSTDK